MARCFFFCLSFGALLSQTRNENQLLGTLDQVSATIAAKNYKSASKLLHPVISYLMMQNKGKPIPSPVDGIVREKDDAALNEAIQKLRGELIQKVSASALKSAYVLGISLTQLDTELDRQTRLRQERIASPEGLTGRAAMTSDSKLILAAYRAGELTESVRHACQMRP